MDRFVYIAAGGASAAMMRQAVTANNLANATNTAFKQDFASFVNREVEGPGFRSSSHTELQGQGTDLKQGTIISTGNDLDVAINGDGWIAVQAKDGTEGYTRAGDLKITATGQLVTGAGLAVKGNGGSIVIPQAEKVEIGADGTVSIRPLGESAANMAVVDRIKLVKPPEDQLVKGLDGLMRIKDGSPAVVDASIGLIAGSLESSNVNPVNEMVRMIEMARHFEMQMQMMKTAEQLDASSNQLLKLGG